MLVSPVEKTTCESVCSIHSYKRLCHRWLVNVTAYVYECGIRMSAKESRTMRVPINRPVVYEIAHCAQNKIVHQRNGYGVNFSNAGDDNYRVHLIRFNIIQIRRLATYPMQPSKRTKIIRLFENIEMHTNRSSPLIDNTEWNAKPNWTVSFLSSAFFSVQHLSWFSKWSIRNWFKSVQFLCIVHQAFDVSFFVLDSMAKIDRILNGILREFKSKITSYRDIGKHRFFLAVYFCRWNNSKFPNFTPLQVSDFQQSKNSEMRYIWSVFLLFAFPLNSFNS